jgi:hypothetical protein
VARAPRTANARRKNRKDANSSADDRPPAAPREESNVEAGWSEGWPPRMAQHDLQTLKGMKTSREAVRIGLTAVSRRGRTAAGQPTRPGQGGRPRPARTPRRLRWRVRRLHAEAEQTNTRTGRACGTTSKRVPPDGRRRAGTIEPGPAQANKAGHVEADMARESKGSTNRTSVARRRQ